MDYKYFATPQFRKDIERDMMFHIILNLRREKLTKQRAKEVAKLYLDSKKMRSPEDLFAYFASLIPHHPEFHEVYLKYAPSFYSEVQNTKLSKIHDCIICQEYEQALDVARETYICEDGHIHIEDEIDVENLVASAVKEITEERQLLSSEPVFLIGPQGPSKKVQSKGGEN